MSATAARAPKSTPGSAVTPVLRAVLLADLVDSTDFIQRFGDAHAAAALQRLDLQIRDLLEFTGGRLIDKADGLLAIFERPIQAVDFALRYQHALRTFTDGTPGGLKARVGIHVGELMTWRNSEAAVAAGAKPLEVEGLAKPVAARLMSLALPGQILISSMAQTLAQRAQAELGDRAERIRWMVHGRYRFKGVPAPLLVHEVGEAGHAPLKAPGSGQKAWKELPFWRRPPVLAVELLVFLGLGAFFGYALLRSPPALGFKERDWVVVGDISNFTGNPKLEEALETGLRISLEQSRFVNVMPQLKVQEVLQRMGRNRQATVDRAVASEIALREGARAVLLPSVAEVDGRVRVSIEVVDPSNQVTVFAESAEGRGAESAMKSLDAVNLQLRQRLGESLAAVQATGVPLEKATTSSLDALRAYSLALDASRNGRFGESMQLLDAAIALDPGFAMAYANRGQLYHGGLRDNARALADYRKAESLKSRMTLRERLVFESAYARLASSPAVQLDKLRISHGFYPDAYAPGLQAAQTNWFYLQQYERALRDLQPSLKQQNPFLNSSWSYAGVLHMALEQYPQAEAAFERARTSPGRVLQMREGADFYASQRRYDEAAALLRKQGSYGLPAADLETRFADISHPLDQGRWGEAHAAADKLQEEAANLSTSLAGSFALSALTLATLEEGAATRPAWRALMEQALPAARNPDHPDWLSARYNALYAAGELARLGEPAPARAAIDALRPQVLQGGYPTLVDLLRRAEAELLIARGNGAEAVALLRPRMTGSELLVLHPTLLRAYRQAGQAEAALAEARWIAGHRGRAYAERNNIYALQALNVAETNLALLTESELLHAGGREGEAAAALARFRAAWPAPPAFAAGRVAALARGLGPAASAAPVEEDRQAARRATPRAPRTAE